MASQIDENSILDAVIVGGGISGLTTALVRCDKVWIEHRYLGSCCGLWVHSDSMIYLNAGIECGAQV